MAQKHQMATQGPFCFNLFPCYEVPMGFFIKIVFTFVPCALVSGALYLKVLLVLRSGRHSAGKARLSKCLWVMWLSWVVLTLPSVVLETIFHTKNIHTAQRYPVYWVGDVISDSLLSSQFVSQTFQNLLPLLFEHLSGQY